MTIQVTPTISIIIVLALTALVWLSIEMGRRVGLRRWAAVPEECRKAYTTLEASIFGLLGLLIAFTFYGAAGRFDNRRNLIVIEADAISTAYLRLDLLPPDTQAPIREDFRTYLRSRLKTSRKVPDVAAVKAELARSAQLQRKIWNEVVASTETINPAIRSLILSSINEMIDATTPRIAAFSAHPPAMVFAMLGFTVIVCSFLAGYTTSVSGIRDWVYILCFAFALGAALYLVLDYEYPGVGLIRVDPVEQVLVDALNEMN